MHMRAASTVVSLATHVGLVVAALWATESAHSRVPSPPIGIVYLPPSDPTRATAPATPGVPLIPEGLSLPPIPLPRVDGVDVDVAHVDRWLLHAPDVPTTPSGNGEVGGGAVDVSVVDEVPVMLAGPLPDYPEALRRAGVEGRVVLEAVVDAAGHVEPASLVAIAATHPGFVAPARRAVAATLFRPALVHGRAVRVRVRIPIEFTLRR
jgi:TonB family protein